jgi:hypothetical protein
MPLSAFSADAALATMTGAYVVLHTGSPGAAGTANVAVNSSDVAMTPKAVSLAAVSNHPSNTERRRLSDADLEFNGTELKPGQTITHYSLWDGAAGPGTDDVLDIAALTTPKLTGSDGATIATGDLEIAITVFAKP